MVKYKEWKEFCNYLINENRYILDKKRQNIVEEIKKDAHKCEIVLKKGQEFWRARLGREKVINKDIIHNPYLDEEMSAPANAIAKGGRSNPQGISYLYLAENIETAIAETKPYIGALIELASFKLKKNLRIIDVRKNTPSLLEAFQKTPKSKQSKISFLWFGIKVMFAIPIPPNDYLGYIPTQYISELFKSEGYDGLIFESVQRKNGVNLVLFNPLNAAISRRTERTIDDIKYIDNVNNFRRLLKDASREQKQLLEEEFEKQIRTI